MTQLLFFGRLRDFAQSGEREMAISSPLSITSIIAIIEQSDPLLASALTGDSVRYALNGEFVAETHEVNDKDELAFLPPVSGG